MQKKLSFIALAILAALFAKNVHPQFNFWQQTHGPGGGSVLAFALNAGGHIWAGGNRRIVRSTDEGDRWMTFNEGLPAIFSASSLAISSNAETYVGTFADGAFRFADDGNRWTAINTGLTNLQVRSLVIDARGSLFAGTWGSGVFRSVEPATSVQQAVVQISRIFS